MSQYRSGTVAVINGNTGIVGTGTAWLSSVATGSVFTLPGSGVPYVVGSVVDDTHITLTGPYAGTTASGLEYSITTSFTPSLSLPYPEEGDNDTATILKRAMLKIEADILARETAANKGAANGYAPLDAGAKIPLANLPAAIAGAMSYQGVWDASTNTPALASGVGTKGYYYKISVAGSTALDGHSTWSVDDVAIFNGVAWDILQGGISSAEIMATLGYVPENEANKAVAMAGNEANDAKYLSAKAIYDWIIMTQPVAQDFRLTLSAAAPVTTADVIAATTLYGVPYRGTRIGLWTGAAWRNFTSSGMSLALGTLIAGRIYDVFCYLNAGVPTLELGTAWTNDTTRDVALAYQDGVLVKSGDATRRYIGSVYTTSTTSTEDSAANRYVWNYYNRVARQMRRIETAVSWAYTLNAYRQMNGSTANQLNFILGVAEDEVRATVRQTFSNTNAVTAIYTGIALDSVTVPSRGTTQNIALANGLCELVAKDSYMPASGKHYIAALEKSQAAGTTTWYGSGYGCGLTGTVMA